MVAIAPFAIIAGAMAAVGLLFYSFYDRLMAPLASLTHIYSADLERAAMRVRSEQIVLATVGIGAGAWFLAILTLHPAFVVAAALLPAFVGLAMLAFRSLVRSRAAKRAKQFNEQLEMVLRMMSSGLRVGLGVRQALVLVTEDVADPARVEFARAVGETNIGTTLDDALKGLTRRMPSDELRMMVDAINVSTQTGSDLAKILDHLAGTIKARRQIRRKVSSLTGEARAGAYVIGALPVFVGAFVMATQPTMRDAMIGTTIGHLGFGLFLTLEACGILCLYRLLKFEI